MLIIMEIQHSSAVIKYEKILQLTFSFESREIISVENFPLVDYKECGGCYMDYILQSFSAFLLQIGGCLFYKKKFWTQNL